MTINDVLFLDTETTGIPERSWKWDEDYAQYPHVVQLAWMHGCKVESHVIRPDGWEIPEEATNVHGITTDFALACGEPFAAVVDRFIQDCHDAGLLCGHNIHFDTAIIKANILRELGREYYDANDVESALYKGKRIDTMRPTMKWVDARTQNGRLKFPTLSELYAHCFDGDTFPAHDALADVKAVAHCLPVILAMNLVELKVKEYPEEVTNPATGVVKMAEFVADSAKAAKIAADSVRKVVQSVKTYRNGPISQDNSEDDKLHVPAEKSPQNENSAKITVIEHELLDQNEF